MNRAKRHFFLKRKVILLAIFFIVFALKGSGLFAAEEETFDDAFDPILKEADTPMVSAVQETATKLQGIGMGGEKSFAIINGEVYKVGQLKNGIRVTQIRRKEADIIINGVPRHLRMNVVASKPGAEIPEETSQDVSEVKTDEEDMNFNDEPGQTIQTHEITTSNDESLPNKEISKNGPKKI